MLAQQRYEMILELLKEEGNVHTADLVTRMGVSSETVRKDLAYLEKAGQLTRVHGGAVPIAEQRPAVCDGYITLRMRNAQHMNEKTAITQYAAEAMVREHQVIALDYGSTSQQMAGALKERFQELTVITNSLQNALILAECPGFTIILTGGVLNKNEYTLIDNLAPIMEQLHIDKYFMSVTGIDPAIGCTDLGFREANVQNWMRQAADHTVILADSSKFGRASLVKVCPVDAVDAIITDSGLSDEMKQAFSKTAAKLIVI